MIVGIISIYQHDFANVKQMFNRVEIENTSSFSSKFMC